MIDHRTVQGDACHQFGDHDEARLLFEEAERMRAERQPQFPLLYGIGGFRYVDLILAPTERAIWQLIHTKIQSQKEEDSAEPLRAFVASCDTLTTLAACGEAQRRAARTLEWVQQSQLSLLSIALDHLTLGRAHLYRAVLESGFPADSALQPATTELDHALHGLRQANMFDHLPKALLTAALLDAARGEAFIPSALARLAEAQQIAERGPMPLYLADIHLTRARLGMTKDQIPMTKDRRESVAYDLREARRLIEKHKYGRRREELADAEALLGE